MAYHDHEWGFPVHEDDKLFEYLLLDSFQAGLNWSMILNKRENFRYAFDDLDIQKIAHYQEDKVQSLMQDVGIIRNQAKIRAIIGNAKAFLKIQAEFGSFDAFIWQFTKRKTLDYHPIASKDILTSSPESVAMSKALQERGFKFVGPKICYAFMQAAGMVNDHLMDCFRRG